MYIIKLGAIFGFGMEDVSITPHYNFKIPCYSKPFRNYISIPWEVEIDIGLY
jgi:hypothetical protein